MALHRVWIPSPNYSSRGGAGVRIVVLHTAEGARTYQELGNFFANPSSGVSSQVGIDDTPGTVGEYVTPDKKSWTQGNANPVAVSAELCAFAEWDRAEWDRHPAMLRNTADWVAEECARFGLPIVALSPAQAQGSGRGVCQHVDLGSWGGSHWDCGPAFPMADVLAMAAGGAPAEPEPEPEEENTVVSQVVKHRDVLSCAQASGGGLWHKYSADGGETWHSEALIHPSGPPFVTATLKETVSIADLDGVLYISTEDESGAAWMCRQGAGNNWDIRVMA